MLAAGWEKLAKGHPDAFSDVSFTWKRGPVRMAITAETLGVHNGTVHTYVACGGELTLYRVFVDEPARGQGYAKKALTELFAFADAMGLEFYVEPLPFKMETGGSTPLSRQDLQRLYASLGFLPDDAGCKVMRRPAVTVA